ncbi:MAG: hypothetical protein VX589_16765 [Myxococcota bacterium]|nr:hypothetical protein [Myxococcota bacterium]
MGRPALASAAAWTLLDADDDPFGSQRAAHGECAPDGVLVEDGVLEIDTGRCPYFAAKQGMVRGLDPGDWVMVTIYHDDLYAHPAAEGHIALLFDGAVMWETYIPIPGRANVLTAEFQVSKPYRQGTRIDFHLHNHGLNHWRLIALDVIQPPSSI